MSPPTKENEVAISTYSVRGLLSKKKIKILPLRAVVDEIFYATHGGPFNVRSLANRVEQDEIFQKEIIRICSNTYYSGRNPIKIIPQAIRRLGPTGFRNVSMQAFLDLEVFHNKPWSKVVTPLRAYSVSTAHACQAASRLVSAGGNLAFLAGLLHKIGLAVHLLNLPDPSMEPQKCHEMWMALKITHPTLSRHILQHWKMPNELLTTIGNYGQLLIEDQLNEMGALLLIAEEITRRVGYSLPKLSPKDSSLPFPQECFQDAVSLLCLTDKDMEKILEETQNALRLTSRTP